MNNLTILIGESNDNIIKMLSDVIDEVVTDKRELVILTTSLADEILLRSNDHHVDLFVLTLNNIRFPDGNIPCEKRIEQALQLISNLKKAFQKPIIALAGWPNDPGFADKAISAGADRFYNYPVKLTELRNAIKGCLVGAFDSL